MKNKDIHSGLDKKEIRDFLAQNEGWGSEDYISQLQSQIEKAKADIEKHKKHLTIQALISENGWKAFNVSGAISDYHRDKYFKFIGTIDEYESFANMIEADK